MKALTFAEEHRFALLPEQIWPFVADTDTMNRAIGMPVAHYSYQARAEGGSHATGTYRQGPFLLARWDEHPFIFVRPRHYEVLREYTDGPASWFFASVRSVCDVTADGDGAIVRTCGEIVTRNTIGDLIARLAVGPRFTRRVIAECRRFEQRQARAELLPTHEIGKLADDRRVRELTARLVTDGVAPGLAARVGGHILRAPDHEVTEMRPYELADIWSEDRDATLVALLRATTIGLLEMRWVVLCPNCRIPKARYSSLGELQTEATCETCNAVFDASLDRLVEVRFAPAGAIREVSRAVYCTGGPAAMPHLVAQGEIAVGEAIAWQVRVNPGAMRLRSPQSQQDAAIAVRYAGADPGPMPSTQNGRDGEPSSASRVELLTINASGITPELLELHSGTATISVRNDTGTIALVALEECAWPANAATASVVGTLQEFRDLFSSDVLAPGVQVAIESLTLLFTDLAGSTAMYERIGQARAFRLVQDHFRILEGVIRANRGAIVKTIGDAVMAVFPAPAHGVRAALAMQRAMGTFQVGDAGDPRRLLKIGLNAGPCVAVNLNERLDYFGTAVNVAARMSGEARGGEIVMPVAVRDDTAVAIVLAAQALHEEVFEATVRGVGRPLQLARFALPDASPTAVPAPPQADDAKASLKA